MPQLRRPLSALALGASIAILGSLFVASPASAAPFDAPVGPEVVTAVNAEYQASAGFQFGSTTTTLHVTLPPEALAIGFDKLGYRLSTDSLDGTAHVINVAASVDIPVPANFYASVTSSTAYLILYNTNAAGEVIPGGPQRFTTTAVLTKVGAGTATENVSLLRANASPYDGEPTNTGFHVTRSFTTAEQKSSWGSVINVNGDPGFWTTTAENWPSTQIYAYMQSADISSESGWQGEVEWHVVNSGATLQITLPASAPADVNWSTGTELTLGIGELYSTSIGQNIGGMNQVYVPLNLFPTSRLSGFNRFGTAAAVSAEFATAGTAYIANGRNYPDALSAAPAAAHAHGPLLLVEQGSLPQETADELLRLQPAHIIIAGGTAAVSDAVKAQLEALYPGTQVKRIAGANRYDTSRQLSEDAFGSAANAFVATGLNFPDALAASAAAAHIGAPVILVDGTASTVDAATKTTFSHLGTTEVYIAGGTGAVSAGIETQLVGLFTDPKVKRLSGSGRYETAVAINDGIFTDPVAKAYLAVGTGYADALAGAALAGSNDAPLYTTPGTCVPQATLTSMSSKGATDITLFGGTAVLNLSVAKLVHC